MDSTNMTWTTAGAHGLRCIAETLTTEKSCAAGGLSIGTVAWCIDASCNGLCLVEASVDNACQPKSELQRYATTDDLN